MNQPDDLLLEIIKRRRAQQQTAALPKPGGGPFSFVGEGLRDAAGTVWSKAAKPALGQLDEFTKAVENEPVERVLAIPAFRRIAAGKQPFWFNASEDQPTAPNLKLGTPKQLATRNIRTLTDEAAEAAGRTPLVGGIAHRGTTLAGRGLEGTASLLLDPTNLLGIGLARKARLATEAGIEGAELAQASTRGGKLLSALAEVFGRGTQSKKAYLATLAGAGFGSGVGGELGGTPGSLIGGFGGGWATMSRIGSARRAAETAAIQKARVAESTRNFAGYREDVENGIRASDARYPAYKTDQGERIVVDAETLSKQIAAHEAALRNPGMPESVRAQKQEPLDALKSALEYMKRTRTANIVVDDVRDFGRAFKAADAGDAEAIRSFGEMEQASQRLKDIEAGAGKFGDFRFREESRGKVGDLVGRPTPEQEAALAQARDLDVQMRMNAEAEPQYKQVLTEAQQARKAAQENILGQMPTGARSAARKYLSALITGEDVKGAFDNLQRRAKGVDLGGLNEAAANYLDLHRAVGQAETDLSELVRARTDLGSAGAMAKASVKKLVEDQFGTTVKGLKGKLLQQPGQSGRYRVKGFGFSEGRPGLDLEYVPPSKSIEESIGEGASANAVQAEELRNARARVKELRAEQARLRRNGEGTSGFAEQIRQAEVDAKALELVRPVGGPRPAGTRFVPLSDATEFVVYKPSKVATPVALADLGVKDARTVRLLNQESAAKVRAQIAERNLTALGAERDRLLQGLDSREVQLARAGQSDPETTRKVARLDALDEHIAGFQSELDLQNAELARIETVVQNNQQALEATITAARDEAEAARLAHEQALAAREEAWTKFQEKVGLSPEAAQARFMDDARLQNEWIFDQIKSGVSGKRLTQGAYDDLIEKYTGMAQRYTESLSKPAQEAFGQWSQLAEQQIYGMSERNALARINTQKYAGAKLSDPDAWRKGAGGWFRRTVMGTGLRNAEAEGQLAAHYNGKAAAEQIADIDYGGLEHNLGTVNDKWLEKVGSGSLATKTEPAAGTQRYYHGTGSLEDITEARPEMFLTPNRSDAEVFARTDAKLTGGKPRVYEFDAEPDALGAPADASGTAVSRGAMRVLNPAGVKLNEAASAKAAWARSVQAIKDPLERTAAILKNAARPITDHYWTNAFAKAGIPEEAQQQIYDLLSNNFLFASRNLGAFNYAELDPSFHHTLAVYGKSMAGIEDLARTKGLMRNLLKTEYRDYVPQGRIQLPDGSVKVLANAERSEITDLYEILQNAAMDPKRANLSAATGLPQPAPALADMLIPTREWGTTQAANVLNRVNENSTWEAVSRWLKDPKAVEVLKRGGRLQPNEYINPEYADDIGKLQDELVGKPTWGWLQKPAELMNKIAASTITGDASFATVQGLIGMASSPSTVGKLLSGYYRNAWSDEGWATLLADPTFRNKLVDRTNRGMGVGRASVTGVESGGNFFQEIPGLRTVGNKMAALDRIAFDRMQLINKMNLIDTLEADVQMLRQFGPRAAQQFVDGIPSLSRLHQEVNLYQSTPQEISNAIIRQANNALGGLSKSQSLLGRNRQTLESTLLFVPGFFRARGGLINSVSKMLRNPDSPEGYLAASLLAREALFRLGFAASVAEITGTSDQFRKETDSWSTLDPRKSGGILSGPLGDGGYLGLSWGNAAPKLYAQLLAGSKPGAFNLSPQDRLGSIRDFFEGRTNPVIGAAVDQLRGQDFMGRPVQTPRDRMVAALGAVAPMFIANTVGEANEAEHTGQFDPKTLGATTAAEFLGLNVRQPLPSRELDAAFQRWQEQQFPGEPPASWRNAPSALKNMAREDQGIANAEEAYTSELGRRVSEDASQRDIVYRAWDERNQGFDDAIAQASAQLSSGQTDPASFKATYSGLQEDRADLAADMRAVLAKAGVGERDEVGQLAGKGPALAHLMAEYNAVKPQSISKRQVTEGGVIPDNDLDWRRFKQERNAVLAKYSPEVQAQFRQIQTPDDPNVQRLQAARETLDTYFDKLPKYRGLTNVEGKTLDAYKSVMNAAVAQYSDMGIKVDKRTVYLKTLQDMERNGQIQNQRQAQIAALALRAATDSKFALGLRNLGAVQYLLQHADAFQWYPWLEAELPSKLTPLISQQAPNAESILQRELRGAQLSSVR